MARITEETIKSWSFETKQLHIGQEDYDHATDARAVPIYQIGRASCRERV